jgi:hypothetical protein
MGVTICLKKISPENASLLSWIREILLSVCAKIDAHERSEKSKVSGKWHFISVKNDGIYLNALKIIDKCATQQIIVFKLLLKNQTELTLAFRKSGLKWSEIAAELEAKNGGTISEQHVRQIIYMIRKNIRKKYSEYVCNEIIQLDISGYRLGKKLALILE